MAAGFGVDDRQDANRQADQRGDQEQPPLGVGANVQRQPADPVPTTAAPRPMTSAQPNWARSGWANGGTSGNASEEVPSPVLASRPMKISDPTPAATRPGTSTRPSVGPPSPEASISRNARVGASPGGC